MNRFLIIFFLFVNASVFAQEKRAEFEHISSKADQLTSHLISFEKFGVKEPGSQELINTKNWLYAYYQSLGYNTLLDSFNLNSVILENVVATKKGLTDKYLIVCGHYDTRTGPGANDNGSGVSVIMEMARLLKDIETGYGIKFIHFSGEESGLIGSTHYANHIVGPQDSNLVLVFNLDQLGGTKGAVDNYLIKCEYDQDNFPGTNNAESKRITDSLARWMGLYSDVEPRLDKAYSSDYMPFEALGYTITGLYQYSQYPQYHTAGDLIAVMDTQALKEIAKGAIGALLHLSDARVPAGIETQEIQEISFYPNPSNGTIKLASGVNFNFPVKLTFSDETGRLVSSVSYIEPFDQLAVPSHLTKFRIDIEDSKGNHFRSKWLFCLGGKP